MHPQHLQNKAFSEIFDFQNTFGMGIKSRNFVEFKDFRYGFNGKEKNDEISGEGNSYDFGERMYDPRLSRFMSLDPKSAKMPAISPYTFAFNNPIRYIEQFGMWPGDVNVIIVIDGKSPSCAIKMGDWTIIYAQNAENAVALMGSQSGGNIAKGSVDNLIIMQHGDGGLSDKSAIQVVGSDKGIGINALKVYKNNPEALKKSNPKIYAELEATKALGTYLQNDATVLNTACGGANEQEFVDEYSDLITTNIGKNKVDVIMSGDDTQYIQGKDEAILLPGFWTPLIAEPFYFDGATVLSNGSGKVSTSNNVYIKKTNPENENIITTKKQKAKSNSKGAGSRTQTALPTDSTPQPSFR